MHHPLDNADILGAAVKGTGAGRPSWWRPASRPLPFDSDLRSCRSWKPPQYVINHIKLDMPWRGVLAVGHRDPARRRSPGPRQVPGCEHLGKSDFLKHPRRWGPAIATEEQSLIRGPIRLVSNLPQSFPPSSQQDSFKLTPSMRSKSVLTLNILLQTTVILRIIWTRKC